MEGACKRIQDEMLSILPGKEIRLAQAMLYKRLCENTLSMNVLEEHKKILDTDIKIVMCKACESRLRFEPKTLGIERNEVTSQEEHKQMTDTIAAYIQSGICPCETELQEKEDLTHGCRLAHLAAMTEAHLPILIYLAKLGCNLDTPTIKYRQTPLVVAVYFNKLETFKYLMSLHVDVNARVEEGDEGSKAEAPLSAAIHFEREEMVQLLLNSDKIQVNCTDLHGQPLLVNCVRLHPEFVEVLLTAGADPNVTASTGNSALMFAVTHRDTELVQMLIKYGADVNIKNRQNEMALLIVIYNENIDLVRILLEAGSDPNYVTDHENNSLLLLASYDGCLEIIRLLIKHGGNVKASNNLGYTPLHIAAWNGHLECVKALLEAGAEHDLQTKDKNTPLALAAHGRHLSVIQHLLPLGCNVNNSDKDLDTPLHYATYNGMTKACELLIKHGADPNSRNKVDSTPLWNAVYQKHKEVVKLLLICNVDLEQSSIGIDQHSHTDNVVLIYSMPRSPLWVAVERNSTDIALLLVTAGYDVYNEKWLVDGDFPPNANNTRFNTILSQYVHSPPRLIAMCRNFLRHHFKLDNALKVNQLQIPEFLKNYLTLADLKYSCEDEDETDGNLDVASDDDDDGIDLELL